METDTSGTVNHWRPLCAAALALCGVCAVGAAIGFFRTPRTYRSTAVVARVGPPGAVAAPPGNRILWTVDANRAESRRIVDVALAGPDWAAAWPRTAGARDGYEKRLRAEVQPGGTIRVSYDDPDAGAARGRLTAFVNAYRGEMRADEAKLNRLRLTLFTQRMDNAGEREKQILQARIDALTTTPADATRLVLPPGPATLVPARHWRDAAWGAAIAGALFALVRGPYVSRAWRTRRVIAAARTAFPIRTQEVAPRPVIPVEDG
jgi:hypothetical protein